MEYKIMNTKLQTLFDNLWNQYTIDSPDSLKVFKLLENEGENVINDHIAIRTFSDERVNVDKLAKFWQVLGYEEKAKYRFENKKLTAKHFEHKTDKNMPKVFISQLETSEFSKFVQETAKKCVDKIPTNLLDKEDILYSGCCWGDLDYDVYQKLLNESEYAAWLYVFGFRANHFTVYVNHMKKLNSVVAINEFLKANGFRLNSFGGEIKGTPNELLEQSSTMANEVSIKFKQGNYTILNSFYEFAKRYPMDNGELYQGFIAASADKLFESTDVKLP
jgi:hypothetical protein